VSSKTADEFGSRTWKGDRAGPAATTAEAKKLLAEGRPHVALADLHLRDNHAYGLIAQLRELGVPVIAISRSIEFPPLVSL
jgi:DNA-binding response OmpR family regulator